MLLNAIKTITVFQSECKVQADMDLTVIIFGDGWSAANGYVTNIDCF